MLILLSRIDTHVRFWRVVKIGLLDDAASGFTELPCQIDDQLYEAHHTLSGPFWRQVQPVQLMSSEHEAPSLDAHVER